MILTVFLQAYKDTVLVEDLRLLLQRDEATNFDTTTDGFLAVTLKQEGVQYIAQQVHIYFAI